MAMTTTVPRKVFADKIASCVLAAELSTLHDTHSRSLLSQKPPLLYFMSVHYMSILHNLIL